MKNTRREILCAALALGIVAAAVTGGDFSSTQIPAIQLQADAATQPLDAAIALATTDFGGTPLAELDLNRRDAAVASRSVGRIPVETRAQTRPVVTPDIQDPFEDVDIQVWPTEALVGVRNRDPEQTTDTEFARAQPVYADLKLEVGDENWIRVAGTEYWLPLASISLTPPPPPAVLPAATAHNLVPGTNRYLGRQLAAERGWTGDQWYALERLFTRESGWNHLAANPVSTARGIPQKMMSVHYGANWRTSEAAAHWISDPAAQINWGLDYIARRYGNPVGAWRFFLRHGWY